MIHSLRPPGAEPEYIFNNLCIRCNSCIQACPTGGLTSKIERIEAVKILTPILSGRKGGCDYDCNACGKVCPSGAIASLPLSEKRTKVIGYVKQYKTRCIPYTSRQSCLACYAACPVEAIKLKKAPMRLYWGDHIQLPYVDNERCIGCGLCEAACPVENSGIKTYPV